MHETVLEAGLESPVVVGHSLGAIVATLYAVEHPAGGVVNVDAPMETEAFTRLLHSLAPQLRGDGFQRVWSRFRESMRHELVAPGMRSLLAAGNDVRPELVLSYWAQLLNTPAAETGALAETLLERVRDAAVPYLAIYAATREPAELEYLQERVPHAEIDSWPVEHHFPHLADPVRFASLLIAFAATAPALGWR